MTPLCQPSDSVCLFHRVGPGVPSLYTVETTPAGRTTVESYVSIPQGESLFLMF